MEARNVSYNSMFDNQGNNKPLGSVNFSVSGGNVGWNPLYNPAQQSGQTNGEQLFHGVAWMHGCRKRLLCQ